MYGFEHQNYNTPGAPGNMLKEDHFKNGIAPVDDRTFDINK